MRTGLGMEKDEKKDGFKAFFPLRNVGLVV
jgi:hypothetical protein